MATQSPTIRLCDYTQTPYLVENVHLDFTLHPTKTRVKSKIVFTKNPDGADGDLRLDGVDLVLLGAKIDGKPVDLAPDAEGLTIPAAMTGDKFTWECETEINPEGNTSLDGLYMSNGMYCTQCEAEGFRKITYYLDRPDVMAPFSVRIQSDLPVKLSNGNPVASGEGWVEWQDPWPKPAYLFALVSGDLEHITDSFTTRSGRAVELNIYVRKGDEDKCDYAMDSLKRAMKWDEDEYGREYDLDLFNIVAVDDFNMGAMENKGLNIFNSALVLASPETATDADYTRIEKVIGHEYFHNWTGNRITCRDWFQLCLKEGLTVFRDQQFSAAMRDPATQRIEDVKTLRMRQFSEDASPLAHPPRPDEYIEINNFYTATVYEKGAEVVGMLRRLVGAENYRKALDLYFERHDGQACTIEDWLKVFEDATGRDLSQFKLWYTSAGTPKISVHEGWDGSTYSLTLAQKTPPTPGEEEKAPRLIPVAVGLLAPDGSEIAPTRILELSKPVQRFTFEGLSQKPVPSILREFSAPVILEQDIDNARRAFLIAHDTDPFNKWEAGQAFALDIIEGLASGGNAIDAGYLSAMATLARDESLSPDFRALALTLPGEEETAGAIADNGGIPDPIAIHKARKTLNKALAETLADDLPALYKAMEIDGPFNPDAADAGKRALRNRIMGLASALDDQATIAHAQFNADNMTEQFAALATLVAAGQAEKELAAFYDRWQGEKLVVDKWFGVQGANSPAETAVETVQALTAHPAFDWLNPNRFRALLGGFAGGNPAGFHRADGAGYNLLADWLIKLDPHNPQIAARLSTIFGTWRRYDADRQAKMKAALERIRDTEGLSKNTSEMVNRLLG